MTSRLLLNEIKELPRLCEVAEYITGNAARVGAAPVFKKTFTLKGGVSSAIIDMSALGAFTLWVNGVRVKDFVLAPGWTEYKMRIASVKFDITDLLKEGENEIKAGVGAGWYGSAVGVGTKVYPIDDTRALILALHLEWGNGQKEIISTDETWLVSPSQTVESTIYDGEVTDARIEEEFDTVTLFPADKSLLYPFDGVPVCEMGTIPVKKVITTPEGDTVFDFGQNLTGYPSFKVYGKAGDTVKIECAEILDKYGNFYNKNYRSAKSRIEFTLRDGENEYTPLYTFFGFRYLRISGTAPLLPENIKAVVVHSDIRRTGYFKCGNEKINKLYENVIWGQVDNFLDVPTDCPQRDERLGWTGDAQVFCRTANLNFDCKRFFEKWLRDLSLAQYPDGGVPRVIPNTTGENPNASVEDNERRHPAAWGDAATVCPYEYYMAYGDLAFLGECFPSMKKWVGYIGKYSIDNIWCIGFNYGDWLALDSPDPENIKGQTEHPLIGTAYYYYSTSLVIKAGHALGEDVSYYEALLPKIKASFNKTFIKDGALTSDTQTACVLALHLGLVDGEIRRNIEKRLIELIEIKGDTLTTGFVGTPMLLDTLTEIGRVDKAYTLLLQEKFPSWLFSVNMGATTIWEHWDGINENGDIWRSSMNSYNHYAYGSVASWLYRTVAGIKYDENAPAYKRFSVEPTPSERLGFASARLDTPHGEISSEWIIEGELVRYTVTVPRDTECTLTIGGVSEKVGYGKHVRYAPLNK